MRSDGSSSALIRTSKPTGLISMLPDQGGRILLYHGLCDNLIPSQGSIHCCNRVPAVRQLCEFPISPLTKPNIKHLYCKEIHAGLLNMSRPSRVLGRVCERRNEQSGFCRGAP